MTASRPRPARPAHPPGANVGWGRARIELKRFLRQRESVVFTIIFPALLLCIFGSVFNQDIAPGVTFSQYFVAGMVASGFVNSGFQALAIGICIERDSGGLKLLSGTPMPRAAYFVGKFLLVLGVAIIQITLLMALGVLFFGVHLPDAVRLGHLRLGRLPRPAVVGPAGDRVLVGAARRATPPRP